MTTTETGRDWVNIIHWIGDAPTSLHGNGAASFDHTTRDEAAVTCRLCRYLLLATTEETP